MTDKHTEWFYKHMGREYGPVDKQALVQAAEQGRLLPDDEVWRSDMRFHISASDIEGLFMGDNEKSAQQQIQRKQLEIIQRLKKEGLDQAFSGIKDSKKKIEVSATLRAREFEPDRLIKAIVKWTLIGCAVVAVTWGVWAWRTGFFTRTKEPETLSSSPLSFHEVIARDDAVLLLDGNHFRGDINERNESGRTPLHVAVLIRSKPIAEKLIAKGADVNAKDKQHGATPLHFCAVIGDKDMADVLLAHQADVHVRDKEGMSPMHRAVLHGHPDVVEKLIARGADVDAANYADWTPLHMAAALDRKTCAGLLVKQSADLNGKTNTELTPLHLAARFGFESIVKMLTANGAKSYFMGGRRMETPLHMAVRYGRDDAVQVLLASGTDVNIKNRAGETPLTIALSNRNDQISRAIIRKSSDTTSRNPYDGRSPLDWACASGLSEPARMLIEKGADVSGGNMLALDDTPLHLAAMGNHRDVAWLLLQKGADIDARNMYGLSPLHVAVDRGNREIAQFLLSRQADNMAKTATGWVPLHVAAARGYADLAEMLLAADPSRASVSAPDQDRETPLHRAVRSGRVEVVQVLLGNGADASAANRFGVSPRDLASESRAQDIMRLLGK